MDAVLIDVPQLALLRSAGLVVRLVSDVDGATGAEDAGNGFRILRAALVDEQYPALSKA